MTAWQLVPQNCGVAMCTIILCPASAKMPMLATVARATKRTRLRAEGSSKAALKAACSESGGRSWVRRSMRRPMGMSKSPNPNIAGRTMRTTRFREGLAFLGTSPITSRVTSAKREMVVMTEPSSVIQLVQSRGSNEERRKRHDLSQRTSSGSVQPDGLLLQGADVRDQRVDGRRVQLLLVPFHLGVALLGAV